MRGMALGKRKCERQETLWIPTGQVAKPPSHPFYKRLDGILAGHGFDDFVEKICAKFYAPRMGRPGLAPGLYFRLLLIGYFEGLDSERGIAWRAADSLGLRDFLGLTLSEAPPDHSTLPRTRRLIDVETHQEVFSWVLQRVAEAGLLKLLADKGYYSTERIVDLERQGLRTYISEPRQGRRRWRGDQAARDAVYSNRRRIRGRRGKALLRRRGERLERPFAHLYETGGLRRTHLRGRNNTLKRVLIHVSALNLGFLMRAALGVGTPRSLQGRAWNTVSAQIRSLEGAFGTLSITQAFLLIFSWLTFELTRWLAGLSMEHQKLTFTTGC